MMKMTWPPKKLFLVDAAGALLSAFLLGVVLVQLESSIGMPREVLYVLSAVAVVLSIYSFSCYFRVQDNWRPFLRAIAVANLLYCATTAGLVVYHYQILTSLGILYFVLELVIIITLAIIELKTASSKAQLRSSSSD